MMTQVFRAKTLSEAQSAALGALGADAKIVMTRRVLREGLAGWLGATDIEIAAVAPDDTTAQTLPAKAPSALPFASVAYPEAAPASRTNESEIADLRNEFRSQMRLVKNSLARPPSVPQELLAEMGEMRSAIERLAPPMRKGDKVNHLIRSAGIESAAAQSLARALKGFEAEKDESVLTERFRDALADLLHVSSWPLGCEEKSIIALVGASGVGKTTTAAKLAAHAKMEGRTVTLVASDPFRVGAIDQLRRFAELMGADFRAASSAADLASTIATVSTDLCIVDTSGGRPKNGGPDALLASSEFEKACDGRARHVLLCLPASVRANDTTRALRIFSPTRPTALVITKLDETDRPSGLVHAPFLAKLPISTLCFGQRVPEDISPATTGAILDYLAPRSSASKGCQ